jgi:hypothetical protein
MEKEGIKRRFAIATLTDIITKAWSDKTTKEYKIFKGLKKENLRDNMTNTVKLITFELSPNNKGLQFRFASPYRY